MPRVTGQAVSLQIPVAWGDMDAFGHVNNVVYLRWFESGRMALFQAVDIPTKDVGDKAGPILAKTTCSFKLPVSFPDTVTVHTTIGRVGTKSFTMHYRIDSEAFGATAAEGDATIVWYDYANAATAPVPDALREALMRHVIEA